MTKLAPIATLLLTLITLPAHAERELDREKAERFEVRHSMIGFRNTLLFYTYADQQAVLAVSIDNKDETFPVKAKVYLFDEKTTEEGLKKWLNNQHSDGLFPDVPNPTSTVQLPAGACKVTKHKVTGESKNPTGNGVFTDYEVKLTVKAHAEADKFKLSAFDDTTKVHVKGK